MKHTGITPNNASLEAIGLEGVAGAQWNLSPSTLVKECIHNGEGKLTGTGALAINTGEFTGRSPKDRFIVGDDKTNSRVDWGEINQSITSEDFGRLLEDAIEYLQGKNVYVRDGAVGADPATRINTRVISELAYSSLFVNNMFLR